MFTYLTGGGDNMPELPEELPEPPGCPTEALLPITSGGSVSDTTSGADSSAAFCSAKGAGTVLNPAGADNFARASITFALNAC